MSPSAAFGTWLTRLACRPLTSSTCRCTPADDAAGHVRQSLDRAPRHRRRADVVVDGCMDTAMRSTSTDEDVCFAGRLLRRSEPYSCRFPSSRVRNLVFRRSDSPTDRLFAGPLDGRRQIDGHVLSANCQYSEQGVCVLSKWKIVVVNILFNYLLGYLLV